MSLFAKVAHHLENIYPDQNKQALTQNCLDAMRLSDEKLHVTKDKLWDQRDCLMITYGDTFSQADTKPLNSLMDFLSRYLDGIINGVHILPFFPYTSDDGFAVQDYDNVRPALGDWQDINEIADKFRLMADIVINHASSSHDWFKQFEQGLEPGRDYFKTNDPDEDLSMVVRPRPFDLLRPTMTPEGIKHVWCTFSHDQVDLNFENPDVLIEFLKIIRRYIDHGVRIFRMDAVAFLWKVAGTTSLHLPQTHEIIKLIRTLTDYIDETIILITETNVPNAENLSYFGNANEAHMIYNFSLPPLLLHALLTGKSEHLRHWVASMPSLQNGCTYLNFTASHDGIGLRPVEGLMEQAEIDLMLDTVELFGGKVTMRSLGNGEEKPYEMNITYFDALKGTVNGEDEFQFERFIASQSIMMSMQGIAAFYVHSLLGTSNDYERLQRKGRNRSINRHKWDYISLQQQLEDPNNIHARVFNALRRRICVRTQQPAFHPDATMYMMQPQSGFFGFLRQHKGEGQLLYSITNLQATNRPLSLYDLNLSPEENWIDLLSGQYIKSEELEFSPYQTVWITQNRFAEITRC